MDTAKIIVMTRKPKANLSNLRHIEELDKYIQYAEDAESKCENLHKPTRSEVYRLIREDYISKYDWSDVYPNQPKLGKDT